MNLFLNEIKKLVQNPHLGGQPCPSEIPGTETDQCLQKIGKILSNGVVGAREGKSNSASTQNTKESPTTPPRVKIAPVSAPRVGRATRANTIHANGTIVRKPFPGERHKEGRVTRYNSINELYTITYEDGEQDEYDRPKMSSYYKNFQ